MQDIYGDLFDSTDENADTDASRKDYHEKSQGKTLLLTQIAHMKDHIATLERRIQELLSSLSTATSNVSSFLSFTTMRLAL